MRRKIRVLVGKPGLDGHDRGAKVVAAALRDAGMEVIYTGLHQSPDQIVEAALQEDVDVVALSVLSGAHMTLFPEVLERMRRRGIGDKLLTGGGIIPPEDMETLAKQGVGRLFGPGSSTQDIAVYIRDWFQKTTGDEPFVAPPLPAPSATPDAWSASAAETGHHAPRPAAAGSSGARGATRTATAQRARAKTTRRATASPTRPARKKAAKRVVKPAGRGTTRRSAKRRGR
ncbi:MAG TPA: cobalamin-dependent protein [Dongiaceae bacterium]|nr:cobalamin-dependent protein [Dongiaceae bacterium]